MSGILAWLSDLLCRASTGDGNVKRALYTDAGRLAVVGSVSCVILNDTDVGAVRPDLAERLAVVDLARIESASSDGRNRNWRKPGRTPCPTCSAGCLTWPPPCITGCPTPRSTTRPAHG